MADLQIRELRQQSDEALLDQLEDLKQEQMTLRLNAVTGELADTTEFRKTRRSIARIRTILRERQLAAQMTKEDA